VKIHILPVQEELQPARQSFRYPKHNKDFGVEQDFLEYLLRNQEILTDNSHAADWHYLPVFWTRWHLNHDYARTGLRELQAKIDRCILNDSKTFTICQYADGLLVRLGSAKIFQASRKTGKEIDIPVLCSPHRLPFLRPRKKYWASFVGRLSTHHLRQMMAEVFKARKDVFIFDGNKGTRFYVRKMLQSYIALAPRGYGGSSFRLFEAMQLGVVPFLIGDLDTRPFKKFINWDEISLFSRSASELNDVLDSFSKSDAVTMGSNAAEVWKAELTYQKWCRYILKELETL